MELFELGTVYDKFSKKFYIDSELRLCDVKNGVSREFRTKSAMLSLMNSIYTDMQFTGEIQEDFSNSRIPTLYFSMWVNPSYKVDTSQNLMRYTFFKKSMCDKRYVMLRSDFSMKLTTI